MSEAFISYSRADSAFADKLSEDLEKRGIPVWIDRESIEGGAAWRASISKAIRSCCAFILILSPRSTQSGQVSKELSVAETHNRLIIPVVLEKCDIPPGMELQLAELQWISFAEHSYEAALERLTRVITEARSRAPAVSTTDVSAPSTGESPSRTVPSPSGAGSGRGWSDKAPAPPTSSSNRKWLYAGGAAVLMAGATLAAFQLAENRGATSPSEATAKNDTKAALPQSSVATGTDSKGSVVPAFSQAISDAARAEPPKPESTAKPAAAPAKQRAETPASSRAAPAASAESGSGRGATQSAVQEARVVASEKPAMVARADPAPQKSENATRADPAPAQASGPIVGNSRTLLYHFPSCPGYSRVSAQARTEFSNARDAERAGYKLSDNCTDPSGGRPAAGVIANSRTHDYFLPHCTGYAATRPEYRVPFNSATEAEKAGYKRSDKCS
jgi:hypothetical protein